VTPDLKSSPNRRMGVSPIGPSDGVDAALESAVHGRDGRATEEQADTVTPDLNSSPNRRMGVSPIEPSKGIDAAFESAVHGRDGRATGAGRRGNCGATHH
jgi:hypothetical protein